MCNYALETTLSNGIRHLTPALYEIPSIEYIVRTAVLAVSGIFVL